MNERQRDFHRREKYNVHPKQRRRLNRRLRLQQIGNFLIYAILVSLVAAFAIALLGELEDWKNHQPKGGDYNYKRRP